MKSREKFVKGAKLEKIYNWLNVCYEYCPYSRLEDDKRFVKIFKLLFEISEKADLLRQVIKRSYFV